MLALAMNAVFHFRAAASAAHPVHRYDCRIRMLRWAPRDGFATLAVRPGDHGFATAVLVSFNRADDDSYERQPTLIPIPA